MSSSRFTIHPVEGEIHGDRQWGYMILSDGEPYLHATTGGTGPCWNLSRYEIDAQTGDWARSDGDWHICELDELIAAVEFLHASDAHKANVERWE